MKKARFRLGLVAEGKTTSSSILRLHNLPGNLGPVKSLAFSAARRLSNTLDGGYAVQAYEDLRDASLVIIYIPDRSVSRVVQLIAEADLPFSDMSFVLCETWLDLEELRPLAAHGAHIGTCVNLPIGRPDWFAIDGSPRAVRLMRYFLEQAGTRVDELAPGGKHFLFASTVFSSTLPLPLYSATRQLLRESGFTGNILSSVLHLMLEKTVEDYVRTGRSRLDFPAKKDDGNIRARHLSAVARIHPEMASLIDRHLALSQSENG